MDERQLEELKRRVEADDPAALYMYAELLSSSSPEEAAKYITLSAQLGYPPAAEKLGDMYYAAGDAENAEHFYKAGAKAGILDCSVKLAVLRLPEYEHLSVRELEELAEAGVVSACAALADYYKKNGNRKQAAYWRSLCK